VLAFDYFNVDHIQSPHGRAPAVATGLKRVRPDLAVYTVQGDGDTLAIGLLEVMYAAIRGEPISVFLVNNAIYGMTGGQMAPTTMLSQRTTTTPLGRMKTTDGPPFKMCEMLAQLEGTCYLARGSVHSPKHVLRTKKFIRDAFQSQLEDTGFSMVEVLSQCPSNWKMSPVACGKWIEDVMTSVFPLGVVKDVRNEVQC
jgi:2-oxoglutarate ferredoxin oxidoreductase subunit beta